MLENNYQKNNESTYTKGQKIYVELLDGSSKEFKIINILDSEKVATMLNLPFTINNPIKVLILDSKIPGSSASYHPDLNVIFAYNDTDPKILHHEIIHSLEMQKPIPEELREFYKKVLEMLPDNSNLNPNFRKDIHEFIADAYSKNGLIETMKDKGLYEEFQRLTEYIFK